MQVKAPLSPRQAARVRRPIDGLLDAQLFKALGEPTRLAMLACLAKCSRPCSVGEIAECCSVDLSVVSRHLATLARAGLLVPTRLGKTVEYEVRTAEIAATLRRLADALEACRGGAGGCSAGARAGGCCTAGKEKPRAAR